MIDVIQGILPRLVRPRIRGDSVKILVPEPPDIVAVLAGHGDIAEPLGEVSQRKLGLLPRQPVERHPAVLDRVELAHYQRIADTAGQGQGRHLENALIRIRRVRLPVLVEPQHDGQVVEPVVRDDRCKGILEPARKEGPGRGLVRQDGRLVVVLGILQADKWRRRQLRRNLPGLAVVEDGPTARSGRGCRSR